MRPLFLRRDYGGAILMAGLILMSAGFTGAALAAGWYGHERYSPKPEPIVIRERVVVPVTCEQHFDCTRSGLVEHYRACNARKRSESVQPKG